MSFFFFSGLASSALGLSLVVISLSSVTTCPSVLLVLFVAMSLISDSSRDPHKHPMIEPDTVSVNLKTPNHTKSLFSPRKGSPLFEIEGDTHKNTKISAVSNWDRILCHGSQFKNINIFYLFIYFDRTISQLLNYVSTVFRCIFYSYTNLTECI